MTKLSINQAWDETRAFLSANSRLVITVMLAFVVLPATLMALFVPEAGDLSALLNKDAPTLPAGTILLLYAALFIQFVGLLTLILVALGRSGTLGEHIGIAAKRTIMLVLAAILGAIVLLPAIIILMLAVAFSAAGALNPNELPPQLILMGAIVALLVLVLSLRMALIFPAAAAETQGPWGLLKRGWTLGRGNGLKLILVFALLYIAAMLSSYAISRVVGLLAELALGGNKGFTVGGLLVALVSASVGAAFTAVQAGMLASLYRQAETRPA